MLPSVVIMRKWSDVVDSCCGRHRHWLFALDRRELKIRLQDAGADEADAQGHGGFCFTDGFEQVVR